MAAGAIVFAAAVGVAWHGMRSDQAFLEQSARPGANAASAPAPSQPPSASGEAASPKAAPPVVAMPSFDVARIGPDGRAVIAGRAQPGAKIVLLDGGKEIAQGQADANGEWVVLAQDPPLGVGQHELRVIQHIEGRAPVTSDQVVVAIVPDQKQPATPSGAKEETLVMIAPSSGAPTLVQPPSAAGVPKSGDLVMSTLDYDESGHVTVTGKATPGAVVRAYVNDKMVAEGQTGPDGTWRLWYKDERDHSHIHYAESKDLNQWEPKGAVIADRGSEGPKIFRWHGQYWMIVDAWKGLAVYHSDDALHWAPQADRLLESPGHSDTDRSLGHHADVVVNGDRAFLFYFTHQEGADEVPSLAHSAQRTVLQVGELALADGKLTIDRDKPAHVLLGR